MADKGTEATIAPFLRQIEQSHRLGSTIPRGKSSSSTTDPQWHEALCFARITVGPTFLIMAQHILVLHNNEVERRAGAAGIKRKHFIRNPDIVASPKLPAVRSLQRVVRGQQPAN
jgi:hypothetical protein